MRKVRPQICTGQARVLLLPNAYQLHTLECTKAPFIGGSVDCQLFEEAVTKVKAIHCETKGAK